MSNKDTQYSCPARRGSAVCQVEDFDVWCVHCGRNILELNDTKFLEIMEDIFDGQPEQCIIVQQVNCRGKMGSGVAKAIRDRYPQVYEHYFAEFELGLLKLGYTSYIEVEENKIVANICGQDRYGYDGKQYTSYEGLRKGLEDVKLMADALGITVVIPYKIGCGLGGGDWNGVVFPMIEEIFDDYLISHIPTLKEEG